MRLSVTILFIAIFHLNSHAQLAFKQHVAYKNSQLASRPADIDHADLDNDGDQDIVVASQSDFQVAWFENLDGQGTMSELKVIFDEDFRIDDCFLTDIDNDGDIDILTSGYYLHLIENLDGNGTFGEAKLITDYLAKADQIYAADLDGDGLKDIISSAGENAETLWYKNLDGSNFGEANPLLGIAGIIEVADVDNDGDLDIYYGHGKTIYWKENEDGLGNFGESIVISDTDFQPSELVAGDLDNDGDIDLVASIFSDKEILAYINEGAQFGAPVLVGTSTFGATGVAIGDADGDGNPDIYASWRDEAKVVWYKSLGNNQWSPENLVSDQETGAADVEVVDLNGDGNLDVISSASFIDVISWFKNVAGQGNYEKAQQLTNSAMRIDYIHAADYDSDGDIDIIGNNRRDQQIFVLENLNGLGYSAPKVLIENVGEVKSIATIDAENDGDLDLFYGVRAANQSLVWHRNLGGGIFGERIILDDNISWATTIGGADLDHNGTTDIFAGTQTDDRIWWYPDTLGTGNFGPQIRIDQGIDGVSSMLALDYDQDGDTDLFATAKQDNLMYRFENLDSMGRFGDGRSFGSLVWQTNNAVAEDVDGDGDLDFIIAENTGFSIGLKRDDELSYEFLNIEDELNSSVYVNAGDLDNDGDIDIVASVSNFEGTNLLWYENQGGVGNFVKRTIPGQVLFANGVFVEDVDLDGDLDLIARGINDAIFWYENEGANRNLITGSVKVDINGDNCESSDYQIEDFLITVDDGSAMITHDSKADRNYFFYVEEGNYQTSITSQLPDCFSALEPTINSNFVGVGAVDTIDFCLQPDLIKNDLQVTYIPTREPRPGFPGLYDLVYNNTGTNTMDGQICLEHPEQMTFLYSVPEVDQVQNNKLTFNFNELLPLQEQNILLAFVNDSLINPNIFLGQTMESTATINPINGDVNPDDNIFVLEETVVGSFDPNDILVLEGSKIHIDEVENFLHYIIRFQNTGTASAINVRVENVIPDLLDWETFELINSSHPMDLVIEDGREMIFNFPEIYLPDSTTNLAGSNGYISYKIKPMKNANVGDIFNNQAEIFFDFNEPIITNIASTEIVKPVSVTNIKASGVSILPNPSDGQFTFIAKTEIKSIEIYDQLGRLILAEHINAQKHTLDLTFVKNGIYLAKINYKDQQSQVLSLLKQR